MNSPSPRRLDELVDEIVTDEKQAAALFHLLAMVVDFEGNQLRAALGRQAMGRAFSETERFQEVMESEMAAMFQDESNVRTIGPTSA